MASPALGQASSPLLTQKPDDVPDLWFGLWFESCGA